MNLKTLLLTSNECYKVGKKLTVKGIMVHSTGANNTALSRYVGPDDGLLGPNKYGNHWNILHPGGKNIGPHTFTDKNKDGVCDLCGGRQVCVHGFVGKLKDGSIGTYQTLPWAMRGWHAGKAAGNDGYISFEICEDSTKDAAYLEKVYKEAVELCAYLCKEFNLNPLADGVLICHSEGYKRGVASNHGDVMHWWPQHGRSMDGFRVDVAAAIGKGGSTPTPTPGNTGGTGSGSSLTYKEGDVVTFSGTKHYTSSIATAAKTCKPGKATVTKTAPGKAHPYHLKAVAGGSSTVNGWTDAADLNGSSGAPSASSYRVRVTTASLNIRKGPGTSYTTTGSIVDKGIYTIVEEATGAGATKWGKLKSGAGWISLDFVTKL